MKDRSALKMRQNEGWDPIPCRGLNKVKMITKSKGFARRCLTRVCERRSSGGCGFTHDYNISKQSLYKFSCGNIKH